MQQLTNFADVASNVGKQIANTPFENFADSAGLAGSALQVDAFNRVNEYRREMGLLEPQQMAQPSQTNALTQAIGGGLGLLNGILKANNSQGGASASNPYTTNWNPSGIDWFSSDVPDLGFDTNLQFDGLSAPMDFDASSIFSSL